MRLVLLDATRSWLSPLSFCLGIIKANHRISIKDYYLVAEDDSNRPRIPHGFQPMPVYALTHLLPVHWHFYWH